MWNIIVPVFYSNYFVNWVSDFNNTFLSANLFSYIQPVEVFIHRCHSLKFNWSKCVHGWCNLWSSFFLVWYEPTCIEKATKPFSLIKKYNISYASPNLNELKSIYSTITHDNVSTANNDVVCLEDMGTDELVMECLKLAEPCLDRIHNIIITLGKHGVLVVRNKPSQTLFSQDSSSGGDRSAVYYPAVRNDLLPVAVKSVSGAGDR